jgi:hypothetical protein
VYPHEAHVLELDEILQHLLKSTDWSASRSSRAAGQHRDKASTRTELTLIRTGLPVFRLRWSGSQIRPRVQPAEMK